MTRRALLATAIVLALTSLPGCGLIHRDPPPELVTSKNLDRLHGRAWELRAITVDGNNIVMHVDASMSIRFDADGKAQGFGAVNQFTRSYRFDEDGKLTWTTPDFVLTRKGGPPELMDKEVAYFAALRNVNRAIVGKTSFTLQNEDGSTILTFLAPGAL